MDQQEGWTLESVQRVTKMGKDKVPVTAISLAVKRPVEAVRAKLREVGITPVEG